jgi:hypothetical protein
MAAQDAAATGADLKGDARQRSTAQTNGSYIPKAAAEKMDEKTKQKVDLKLYYN